MRLVFRSHARRQLLTRHIRIGSVVSAVRKPDIVVMARNDTMKAKKFMGRNFLNVIYKREDGKIVIITAFSTRR